MAKKKNRKKLTEFGQFMEKGDIDRARTEIEKYLQDDPQNPVALLVRGIANGLAGELEAAEADLDMAVSLSKTGLKEMLELLEMNDTTGAKVCYTLALIAKSAGKQAEVCEWLAEAYKKTPTAGSLQLLLDHTGNSGQGSDLLNALFPEHEPGKRFMLAEQWINTSFPVKAIPVLETLENLPGVDHDRVNLLKAMAYLKINRIDDAAECAGRVQDGSIYGSMAKSIQAYAYLLNGKTDGARFMAAGHLSPEECLRVAQFLLEQCGKIAQEGQVKFPGHPLFINFLQCFKV